MKIIGHRGCMLHAPENTLAAFRRAWEEGADGVELDVHLTRDGEIVVHHDADLSRTAGRAERLADMVCAELDQLDVGAWKDAFWRGERIPVLDEVLQQAPESGQIMVEIKCGPEIVPALVEKARGGVLQPERILFVGFDLGVMAATKAALNSFRVLLNVEPEQYEGDADAVARLADSVVEKRLDGIGAGLCRLDWHALRYWKSRGLWIFAWVVRDAPTARELESLGVEASAADCPAELRTWLQRPAST